jgi:hypothetical protein
MHDILPWLGLVALLTLCLPILPVQRVVLDVSTWALRLALVALLLAGAYLWFRPGDMPRSVSAVLSDFPGLLALLPERGSPAFALSLACWIVTALVPLLAAFELTRHRAAVREWVVVEETRETVLPLGEPVVDEVGVPILRPIERRTAAAALAVAGSRTTH